MTIKLPERATPPDPDAQMEQLFIDQYLFSLGLDRQDLHEMPEEWSLELMAQASSYARCRMAEIEARDDSVEALQGARPRIGRPSARRARRPGTPFSSN
jgi:hypothetical protein